MQGYIILLNKKIRKREKVTPKKNEIFQKKEEVAEFNSKSVNTNATCIYQKEFDNIST